MYIDNKTIKIKIKIKEVLRYMGCFSMDENSKEYIEISNEINEIIDDLIKIIKPKYVYKKFNINEIDFQGEDINRYLCGETESILIAVTIGHEYENECKKVSSCGNIKRAVILDAIGTAVVEECCDFVEAELRNLNGKTESSRFSPGYGDFDINFQKQLLDMLHADKIGIYCNEVNMMFPQKTVTAIVKFAKFNSGCKGCSKGNCDFKKS